MGEAFIVKNLGEGLYKIKIDKNKALCEKRIAEIDALIAESDPKYKKILEKKKTKFLKLLAEDVEKTVWCADLSTGLEDQVETIEINGEGEMINLEPKSPGFSSLDKSLLTPLEIMTPAQAAFNFALQPAWQKFKPTHRYGQIVSIENGLCNVDLFPVKNSITGGNTNIEEHLKDVPVKYMSCNSSAFSVNDVVIIEFENQNWETPKIIGFKNNPRACEAFLLISTPSGAEAVVWDAVQNKALFGKDSKENLLKKMCDLGFCSPQKASPDGTKLFEQIPWRNQLSEGMYFNTENGPVLYVQDDVQAVLFIHPYCFGSTKAQRNEWEVGDTIVFRTFEGVKEAAFISQSTSSAAVFNVNYINYGLSTENPMFTPIDQIWTITFYSVYNDKQVAYYITGDTVGVAETTCYTSKIGFYPITKDLNERTLDFPHYPIRTLDVKEHDSGNYIEIDNKIYSPVVYSSFCQASCLFNRMREKYKDATGVYPEGLSFSRVFLYFIPLFAWDYESTRFKPEFNFFESVNATTILDLWGPDPLLHEDQGELEYAVGKVEKGTFKLFYDAFSHKENRKSHYFCNFAADQVLGEIELDIFRRINNIRVSLGLNPLVLNLNLCAAAKAHAQDMSSHYTYYTSPEVVNEEPHILWHIGSDGSYPYNRIINADYFAFANRSTVSFYIGENVSFTPDVGVETLAEGFVNGWVNSPGHYANLTFPEYVETGIAIIYPSEGGCFAVQVFGFCGTRPAGISPLKKLTDFIRDNFTWTSEEKFIPDVFLL